MLCQIVQLKDLNIYTFLDVPVRASSEISRLEEESPLTDIKHEKPGQNTNCIFNEHLEKFDIIILWSDIVALYY